MNFYQYTNRSTLIKSKVLIPLLMGAFIFYTLPIFANPSWWPPEYSSYVDQISQAQTTEEFWYLYENEIESVFRRILFNGGANEREVSSHNTFIADLKNKFGYVEGSKLSARSILENYNRHIDDLVNSGTLSEEDVIRPVIALEAPNGDDIVIQFGEPVELGSVSIGLIPGEVYGQFLADGKFPIGDSEISNSGIPAFFHDISHLAGFLENPEYMRLLRKYAKAKITRNLPNTGKRSYFFNEGLTVLNPEYFNQINRTLLLSDSMRSRLQDVSLKEIYDFLALQPKEDLLILSKELHLMLYNPKIVQVLGGAGRDPFSYNSYPLHGLIHPDSFELLKFFTRARDKQFTSNLMGLTRAQIALIKLQEINVNDWFDTLFVERLPLSSPITKLIESGAFPEKEDKFGNTEKHMLVEAFGIKNICSAYLFQP